MLWRNCKRWVQARLTHLRQRWSDLFGAKFDVLLYDLTSTYFECDVPEEEQDPHHPVWPDILGSFTL